MNKIFLLVALLGINIYAQKRVDIAIPNIEEIFLDEGISPNLYNFEETTDQSIIELDKYLLRLLKSESELKSTLRFGRYLLNKAKSFDEKIEAVFRVKRIIYTVLSTDVPPTILKTFQKIKSILRYRSSEIPYLNLEDRKKKISNSDLKKVAKSLYDKNNQKVSISMISKMNYEEIADLDVSRNHPLWHQTNINHSFEKLEKWTEAQLRVKLKDKTYSIKKAKKIMFASEIKTTATSPKLKARDIYGEKWKLKWGNEVHAEVIANRLYAKLGGKFTDLVYSGGHGAEGTILILGNPEKEDNCDNIVTVMTLSKCFLDSKYNFNIDQFIFKSGLLSDLDVSELINSHSNTAFMKKKMAKNSFFSRHYVMFYESLVELKSKKVMERSGPSAFSSLGANSDRAIRGLSLFNSWINNVDIKDFNNKGVLLKDSVGKEDNFVEYMHDLGASLGFLNYPASANDLQIGTQFMDIRKKKNKLIIKEARLYSPDSWEHITFTDALWMAKKIVKVSKDEISEILKATKWPKFTQDAMSYRLLKRRDQIAKLFNITNLLPDNTQAPNFKFKLNTIEDRRKTANSLKLKLSDLDRFIKKISPDFKSSSLINLTDVVLRDGKIASCHESIIVNLLESSIHPSGLSRRLDRDEDHVRLKPCKYNSKEYKSLKKLKRFIFN